MLGLNQDTFVRHTKRKMGALGRPHGNAGRRSNNHISPDRIDLVVDFLQRFAHRDGKIQPNRMVVIEGRSVPVIVLPRSCTHSALYTRYKSFVEECGQRKLRVSASVFKRTLGKEPRLQYIEFERYARSSSSSSSGARSDNKSLQHTASSVSSTRNTHPHYQTTQQQQQQLQQPHYHHHHHQQLEPSADPPSEHAPPGAHPVLLTGQHPGHSPPLSVLPTAASAPLSANSRDRSTSSSSSEIPLHPPEVQILLDANSQNTVVDIHHLQQQQPPPQHPVQQQQQQPPLQPQPSPRMDTEPRYHGHQPPEHANAQNQQQQYVQSAPSLVSSASSPSSESAVFHESTLLHDDPPPSPPPQQRPSGTEDADLEVRRVRPRLQ